MERSEADTRQRYANQIVQLEKEIAQLKKRVEQEVEQRHTVERNQDVSFALCFLTYYYLSVFLWNSIYLLFFFLISVYVYVFMYIHH